MSVVATVLGILIGKRIYVLFLFMHGNPSSL